MAVTFPLSMPTSVFSDVSWTLRTGARGNAAGLRNAISALRVTDPFFTARYVTSILNHAQIREWEAFIEALDGPMNTFLASALHRKWPRAHYPSGLVGFNGVAALTTWAGDGDMQITGCPTGFTITTGDLIELQSGTSRTVVRALQGSTTGATRKIAVAGLVNPVAFPSGSTVRFYSPTGHFRLVSFELSQSFRNGIVTMEAEQVLA